MNFSFKNHKILVTGGAGYIGSHTVVKLLEVGAQVIILDNLCNSRREVIERIKKITGHRPRLIEGDVRDQKILRSIFNDFQIDSVIHFAGLKAVGESVQKPVDYYSNNVFGSINLIEEMSRAGIKRLVFSSSATVYGDPDKVPITEDSSLKPTSPYGRSKLMVEDILRDLHKSDTSWSVAILRYFNPVGAHESGLIGEDPCGTPNNLMPFLSQVAIGKREKLMIFGDDYETLDGTGIRDYIHVDDLANGHLAAISNFKKDGGLSTFNLGTGQGYSVLQMVKAFEQATKKTISYEVIDRRPGDISICFASPNKARDVLGWRSRHDINRMCVDTWRWQCKNPNGYLVNMKF